MSLVSQTPGSMDAVQSDSLHSENNSNGKKEKKLKYKS